MEFSTEFGDDVDQGLIRFAILRREARHGVAEVGRVEFRVCVDFAGEKAFAERAEGNEADAELFEGGDDFFLGLAPEERVFALQRGDGLNGMGAADGLRAGFGEAEVLHLTLLD